MKTYPLITMILVIAFGACQKSQTGNTTSPSSGKDSVKIIDPVSIGAVSDTTTPFPQQTLAIGTNAPGCPLQSIYGDTLIYPQPSSGQDVMLSPVNISVSGSYFAWPAGIVIDRNTGVIDLTQSQSGMRYLIGFVPSGTTDTCLSNLIIGGASYYDSVYVVANGGTRALPYFDANPSLATNCDGSGQGSGCKFDVTGSAAAQSVAVNNSSGEIDLQKTMKNAFGANPVDGQTIVTSIYYQLKHGSNNALQRIDVQLVYYSSMESVSSSLMTTLNSRLYNTLNSLLISTSANPRPPLIIIVRRK